MNPPTNNWRQRQTAHRFYDTIWVTSGACLFFQSTWVHQSAPFLWIRIAQSSFSVCVCVFIIIIFVFGPMHITFVCCYFWLTVRCFQTFLAFYAYDSYMYVVRAIICFDIVSSRVKNKSWNMDSSHFANKIIPLHCKV